MAMSRCDLTLSLASRDQQICTHMTTMDDQGELVWGVDELSVSTFQPFSLLCHVTRRPNPFIDVNKGAHEVLSAFEPNCKTMRAMWRNNVILHSWRCILVDNWHWTAKNTASLWPNVPKLTTLWTEDRKQCAWLSLARRCAWYLDCIAKEQADSKRFPAIFQAKKLATCQRRVFVALPQPSDT